MEKTKMNKKGIMLSQAFTAVLTIVLVALLVIVAIVIFSSLETATLTPSVLTTSINESLPQPTTTGITLTTGNSAIDGVCGSISSVINGSGHVITSGNWTQTGCRVVNTTSWSIWSANVRYTYPYTLSASSAASNASVTTITNFSGYPALIGLVGTIVFLALVIGVLVASFVFGGRSSA